MVKINTNINENAYKILKGLEIVYGTQKNVIEHALANFDPEAKPSDVARNKAFRDLDLIILGRRSFYYLITKSPEKMIENNVILDFLSNLSPKPLEDLTMEEFCALIVKANDVANWFKRINCTNENGAKCKIIFHHDFDVEFSEFMLNCFYNLLKKNFNFEVKKYLSDRYFSLRLKVKKSKG